MFNFSNCLNRVEILYYQLRVMIRPFDPNFNPKDPVGQNKPASVFFEKTSGILFSILVIRSPTCKPASSAAPPFPTSIIRISRSPSWSRPVASKTPERKKHDVHRTYCLPAWVCKHPPWKVTQRKWKNN